jgi:RNA polymerase sigma-32 factor
MEMRMNQFDQSIDTALDDDSDLGVWQQNSIARALEDPNSDIESKISHDQISGQQNHLLYKALKTLDKRSLEVLHARWLSHGKKATLHDLAAHYNISAERIRQIEKVAMDKIKQYIIAQ